MKLTASALYQASVWIVPLLILCLMAGLVHTPFFAQQPARLSLGITVDLVLTTPLLYWLLIRRRSTPSTTVLPLFLAGVITASIILPKAYQAPLTLVKTWILPAVELGILMIVLTRLRKIYFDYRRERTATNDFYTALRRASASVLPRGVSLVVTAEIAVFYYSFLVWQKRKLQPNEFSYHRTSGSTAILAVIMFLVIAETAIVHLLVIRWSPVGAWLLTTASAYTVVQLAGLMRAMRRRPISIDGQCLRLRYGFLQETAVPVGGISSVQIITSLPDGEETRLLSPLGELEPPNILIKLNHTAVMQTMYGSEKSFTQIGFYVDEPERLTARLTSSTVNSKKKRSD